MNNIFTSAPPDADFIMYITFLLHILCLQMYLSSCQMLWLDQSLWLD